MLELLIEKRLDGFYMHLRLATPEEKTTVLFGPSGAGKSMTLAAISGVVTPDAGRIAVGERAFYDSERGIDLPPQQRRIGLVKQDLALFPHLTVEKNIAYGLFKEPRAQVKTKVQEFLRLTNLDGLGMRKPAELSGGQQQRVALARALAIQPSLLLLDEPFSALDYPTRVRLREELKTLQQELRTTLLFVTHDLGEAYVLADYLAVMDRGRILQCDVPDQVLGRPATLRVAQVVGVKNIIPGIVLSSSRVRVGLREVKAPAEGFVPGARVFICVRPERITLVRKERHPADLPNVMEGEFVAEESDGANVRLWFRAQGARLLPSQPFDLEVDTPVYVHERLNLAAERHWRISIKPGVMHLISG
jgi:molybdate transport system ATP-binding protein